MAAAVSAAASTLLETDLPAFLARGNVTNASFTTQPDAGEGSFYYGAGAGTHVGDTAFIFNGNGVGGGAGDSVFGGPPATPSPHLLFTSSLGTTPPLSMLLGGGGGGEIPSFDPVTGSRTLWRPSWTDVLLEGAMDCTHAGTQAVCVTILAAALQQKKFTPSAPASSSLPSPPPPSHATSTEVAIAALPTPHLSVAPTSVTASDGAASAARLALAQQWVLHCLYGAMGDVEEAVAAVAAAGTPLPRSNDADSAGAALAAAVLTVRAAAAKEYSRWPARHVFIPGAGHESGGYRGGPPSSALLSAAPPPPPPPPPPMETTELSRSGSSSSSSSTSQPAALSLTLHPQPPAWSLRAALQQPIALDALPPFIVGRVVEAVRSSAALGRLPPLHCGWDGGSCGGEGGCLGGGGCCGVSAAQLVHALKALAFLTSTTPFALCVPPDPPVTAATATATALQAGAAPDAVSALIDVCHPPTPAASSVHMCSRQLDRGVVFPLAHIAAAFTQLQQPPPQPTATHPPPAATLTTAVLRQCARLAANLAYGVHANCRGGNSGGQQSEGDDKSSRGALLGGVCEEDLVVRAGVGGIGVVVGKNLGGPAPLLRASPLVSLAASHWASSPDIKLRCHALRLLQNTVGAASVSLGDRLYPLYDNTAIGTALVRGGRAAVAGSTHGVPGGGGGGGTLDAPAFRSPADGAPAALGPAVTDVDIVFIHGLQGAPLKTWRTPAMPPASPSPPPSSPLSPPPFAPADASVSVMKHGARMGLWPTAWLAPDLLSPADLLGAAVGAVGPAQPLHSRMFAVNYDSDIFIGGAAAVRPTVGVEVVARDLREQLAAAGVGSGGRRVVFIAHSMGGILLKELLPRPPPPPPTLLPASSSAPGHYVGPPLPASPSLNAHCEGRRSDLARATVGVVFIATPHRGSPLASSSLQRLGVLHRWLRAGDPATSVSALVHMLGDAAALESLDGRFLALVAPGARDGNPSTGGGHIRVLSLGEGLPTNIPAAAGWTAPPRTHLHVQDGVPAPPSLSRGEGGGNGEGGDVDGGGGGGDEGGGGGVRASPPPSASRWRALPDLARTLPSRLTLSDVIVPPASADPRYGDWVLLRDADHISVCKPASRDSGAYRAVLRFVREACAGGGGGGKRV